MGKVGGVGLACVPAAFTEKLLLAGNSGKAEERLKKKQGGSRGYTGSS